MILSLLFNVIVLPFYLIQLYIQVIISIYFWLSYKSTSFDHFHVIKGEYSELIYLAIFTAESIMRYVISASIALLGIIIPMLINGSSYSRQPKGFGFQKEHDGSIIGMEDGVQQIRIAGTVYWCFVFSLLVFSKFLCSYRLHYLALHQHLFYAVRNMLWRKTKSGRDGHRLRRSLSSM